MELDADTLELLGTVVGAMLVAVGLAVLVDLPTALATGVGVAIGQGVGAVGSIVLGAGLVLLVRR